MKAAGIPTLEGRLTIEGQIEAREKCLASCNFKLNNPEKSDVAPGFLKAWKESHEEEIEKLKSL